MIQNFYHTTYISFINVFNFCLYGITMNGNFLIDVKNFINFNILINVQFHIYLFVSIESTKLQYFLFIVLI